MQLTINVRGKLLSLAQPIVMGVLNCTPDSFYAESRMQDDEAIARRAHQIVDEGGAIIDVGGCSTRPGGDVCDEPTEMKRVREALKVVRHELPDAVISVDTFRPNVARMAVNEFDADIINDVSEGADPDMFPTVVELRRPYIFQSVQPTLPTIVKSMAAAVEKLRDLGQNDIILDPGFGFGKDIDQNYAVLNGLDRLQVFELPILIGVSRKRMIRQPLEITTEESLNGTTVVNTLALTKGANILRVHDVRAAVEACRLYSKMISSPIDGETK
ncbi:MAG: dihydropteroate synthase [Prevotella sp.]